MSAEHPERPERRLRRQPDVTNGEDGIYGQGGSASVLRLRRRRKGKGLRGSLTGVSA